MALRIECQPLAVYTKSVDKKHIHRWKNGWKHLFHCQVLLTVQLLWCGQKNWRTISIIIWCKFLILFIGQGPIMWPTNNCLQIMLRSWAMSSYCVSLQIILCSCVNETTLFSCLRLLLRDDGRLLRFPKIFIKKQTWWSNDYWTTQ